MDKANNYLILHKKSIDAITSHSGLTLDLSNGKRISNRFSSEAFSLADDIVVSSTVTDELFLKYITDSIDVYYLILSYDGLIHWVTKDDDYSLIHGGVILLKAGSLASIKLSGGSKLTIATFKSALFKDVYTTKQLCVNLDTTYLHAIHRIITSLGEDEGLMLAKMKTIINLFEMNAASHSQGLYNDLVKVMTCHANDSRFVMDELVAYLNRPHSMVYQVLAERNTTFAKLLSKIRIDLLTNKLLAEPCEGKRLVTIVNECGFSSYNTALHQFQEHKGLTPNHFRKIAMQSHCIIG